MNFLLSKKIILLITSLVILLAIPLTIFLLSQTQDLRQKAAGQADLAITGLQLTDAGGNVRTVFGTNEDIYVRIRIKNQGTDTGSSSDNITYTEFYSDKPNQASPNETSDVNIRLRNGEFSPNFEKIYESRWNGDSDNFYSAGDRFFSKSSPGTYTARVYVNFNGNVAENNLANNQDMTLSYTVTANHTTENIYISGNALSSRPVGFNEDSCTTTNDITACYNTGPLNGRGVVKLTNNSSVTKTAGMALYKSYEDYPNPYPSCSENTCPEQFDWIWTQTIYSARVTNLSPGETSYISLPIPSCNWQMDAFENFPVLLSLHLPSQTYSLQNRILGGGWLEQNSTDPCMPNVTDFPVFIPTSTPLPSPVISPTSAILPTPTDIPAQTPTPTTIAVIPTDTVFPTPTIFSTPTLPTNPPANTPAPTNAPTTPPTAVPTQIQEPTIPLPSPTPTIFVLPTNTPTPTVIPTNTPFPTPTVSQSSTTIVFNILLHGIGSIGDSVNPANSISSNKNPLNPQRNLSVNLLNSQGDVVNTSQGLITYNPVSGSFQGAVDIGSNIQSGSYNIRVKTDKYISTIIPGIQNIIQGSINNSQTAALITGDIDNDNSQTLLDFNILFGCYSDTRPARSCTPSQKSASDLTDDGIVNQFDLNLFLREWFVQKGQ